MFSGRQFLEVLDSVVRAVVVKVMDVFAEQDGVIGVSAVPDRVRPLDVPRSPVPAGGREQSRFLGGESHSPVTTTDLPFSTSPIGVTRSGIHAEPLSRFYSCRAVVAGRESCRLPIRVMAVSVSGRLQLFADRGDQGSASARTRHLRHRRYLCVPALAVAPRSLSTRHRHTGEIVTQGAPSVEATSVAGLGPWGVV